MRKRPHRVAPGLAPRAGVRPDCRVVRLGPDAGSRRDVARCDTTARAVGDGHPGPDGAPPDAARGDRPGPPPAAHAPVRPGIPHGGAGPGAAGAVRLLPALRPPGRDPDQRVQERHDQQPDPEREHLRQCRRAPDHLRLREDGRPRGRGQSRQPGRLRRAGTGARPGRPECAPGVLQPPPGPAAGRGRGRRAGSLRAESPERAGLLRRRDQAEVRRDPRRGRGGECAGRRDPRAQSRPVHGDQPRERPRPRGDGAYRDRRHPHLRARGAGPGAAPRGGPRQPARASPVPGPAGRGACPAGRCARALPARPDGQRECGHGQRRRGRLHGRGVGRDLCRRHGRSAGS